VTKSIDARGRVAQLRKRLAKRGQEGQTFGSLAEFLSKNAQPRQQEIAVPSDLEDHRRPYLDAIVRALSGLYVHMPFKRARHGASPIDRLNALALNLRNLSELDFQQALLAIFLELHDPHTLYVMPEPFKSATAFLPFLVAVCYETREKDGGTSLEPQFVVTRVAKGFDGGGLEPGVRITHWNGVPMKIAVHQMALRENGANRHACFARAVANLTIRPLSRMLPPESVTLTMGFEPAPGSRLKKAFEVTMDWSVRELTDKHRAPENLRTLLFGAPPKDGWEQWGNLPFDFKTISLPHPTAADDVAVGIIRIRSFRDVEEEDFVKEEDDFVKQFARLIDKLAREAPLALIVDVRGNSGGIIQNGERILQMLTPGVVTPTSFQFLNTPLVRQLVKKNEEGDFDAFGLDEDTGTIYSRPAPITSADEANDIGQRYYGRVALITDALCYSTTDIFAAGFQDHRIGPVIGVDRSTGAGGANVWKYNDDVAKELDAPRDFPPLEGDIRMSVRQCLRTGRFQGQVLEDFGVAPDYFYPISEKDLFEQDRGLYEFAFGKLLYGGGLKYVSVDLKAIPFRPGGKSKQGIEIHSQTSGVSRCEILINKVISDVFESHPDGCRSQGFAQTDGTGEAFNEVEVRCYEILQKSYVPFYTETQVKALRDGDKRNFRLIASRKVFLADFEQADKAVPLAADFLNGKRRKRVLYIVPGSSPATAMEALAVVDELVRIEPKIEVRLASYGRGVSTLQSKGRIVIDLDLPDRPGLFRVQDSVTGELRKKWLQRFAPQLIVAHDEYEIAQLAGPPESRRMRRGSRVLPCPCVLITTDLDHTRWVDRDTLHRNVWETLLLETPSFLLDPDLLKLRVTPTGPILRPLHRLWRKEMSESPLSPLGQLAKLNARAEARKALGFADEEFIAAVFIEPGGRTELAAPVYEALTRDFARIDETLLVRKVLDKRGNGHSGSPEFEERSFAGKSLHWDKAARTRSGITFESDDYELMMAACDAAITKGDRNVNLELAYMGVPTFSAAYWDDLREPFADIKPGRRARSAPQSLLERLAPRRPADAVVIDIPLAPDPAAGLQKTALRLKELLIGILESDVKKSRNRSSLKRPPNV
jgi:hypothetical protein